MSDLVYELTFKGAATGSLCAAFEECDVTTGHGITILRCDLPDQAALRGMCDRIKSLGLELLDVRPVTEPSRREARAR